MKKPLPFPELEEERDRSDSVKQHRPILVILGNPPYNGFAGMAIDEERALSESYRRTEKVRRPEGQGLNDLYVRFFRMAERRIAEKTGRGIVCFISNYSWLDGLSFTGMRERYLQAFDAIRIDCLNGDKYKTGKIAPDGSPDPSIFSSPEDPVGIQVGTAITTLVRKDKDDHTPTTKVGFRHLWGEVKRAALTETAETAPDALYESIEPVLQLGLPFAPTAVSPDWFKWPALTDLFPISHPGVKSGRDPLVVDTDLDRLKSRVEDYFNADVSHDEIEHRYPTAMRSPREYDAREVRDTLLRRGLPHAKTAGPDKADPEPPDEKADGPTVAGYIPYAYRPFDNRWLYWETRAKLVDRPRPKYKPHVFASNKWLVLQKKARPDLSPPYVISNIGDLNLMNSGVYCVPAWLREDAHGEDVGSVKRSPNLEGKAEKYLRGLGASVEDLFHHVLAVLHDPAYRAANAGALRMEWPHIPLPGWPAGNENKAAPDGPAHDAAAAAVLPEQRQAFFATAARGRELARLLDSDAPVPGVTVPPLRPELATIAVPATTDGHNMTADDFAVTAGWGRFGVGQAVMPGAGRAVERAYTAAECAALNTSHLGATTFDIHLNDHAYWRNVPASVWNYKLGGYQVLKKWLSYREQPVLDRPLLPAEVQHFAATARRIAAILMVTATLRTN